MKSLLLAGVLALLSASSASFSQEAMSKNLKSTLDPALNQLQFIGTHNSYHIAPSAQLRELIEGVAKGQGEALDYTHRPLTEQLEELGIRQIELDLYGDPTGGLYSNPLGPRLTGEAVAVENPVWKSPGFKILHSPDFDVLTTVPTLRIALRELRAWSDAHPTHEPVLVLLELKEQTFSPVTQPPPFDEAALVALETEIREEMPAAKILTPDTVRGDFPTLREAVTQRGWPHLSEVRGKFLFALDNEDAIRERYLGLGPSNNLSGRVCFVSVPPEHAAAAWMKRNDPVASFDEIRALVAAGFMVRTRADSDLKEIRAKDYTRRDKAFASGAQWISTDAPEPNAKWPDYGVAWPGHAPFRVHEKESQSKP